MTDPQDDAGDAAARRRLARRGQFWPVFLVGLILANVAFDLSLVFLVSSDRSFAVEKDYYQKGLHWNDEMAQQRTNGRLGWTADVTVHPSGVPGESEIVATLRDAQGAPVGDAIVTADVFHNARAADVQEARFAPRPDGRYVARLPLRRPGVWEFRVHAVRAHDTFTATLQRELGPRP
jgi:nitrogen fixation protein FixH